MDSAKKQYLVVECAHCNRFLLALSSNETRTCPYCGKRLRVGHAKVLARSETAEEARLVLQDLKAREGQTHPI
jgi:DNA-directed RNA polymerase subunit RPC12/RpoP